MPPRGPTAEVLCLQTGPGLEFQFLPPTWRPSQEVLVAGVESSVRGCLPGELRGPICRGRSRGGGSFLCFPHEFQLVPECSGRKKGAARRDSASLRLSDPPSHRAGPAEAGIARRGRQGSFILHNAFGQTAPERGGGGGCQARNAHTCTWEGSFEFLLLGGLPGAWPLAVGGSLAACAPGRSTPPRPPSGAATSGEMMAHHRFLKVPQNACLL